MQPRGLSKLNIEKTNNTTRKWAKNMNIHFTEADRQMKDMKRCAVSVIIHQRKQIKTTRHHSTSISMAETPPNAGEDADKADHSHPANGNVKWCSHSRKQFGSFL